MLDSTPLGQVRVHAAMTTRAQVYLAGLTAFFTVDYAFRHAQIGRQVLLVLEFLGEALGSLVAVIL